MVVVFVVWWWWLDLYYVDFVDSWMWFGLGYNCNNCYVGLIGSLVVIWMVLCEMLKNVYCLFVLCGNCWYCGVCWCYWLWCMVMILDWYVGWLYFWLWIYLVCLLVIVWFVVWKLLCWYCWVRLLVVLLLFDFEYVVLGRSVWCLGYNCWKYFVVEG